MVQPGGREHAAVFQQSSKEISPTVSLRIRPRTVTSHAQGWCAVVVLTARAVGAAPDPIAAAHRLAARNAARDSVGS